MTEELKRILQVESISWATLLTVTAPPLVAMLLAVVAGVYGYGQLSQRVTTLEELRPLASKLATIEAYQTRAIIDIGRVQADIAELRRELGTPRRWDRNSPEQP